MSVSVEKYQELKKKAQDAKAKKDRAEGALSEMVSKLKDEFGCSTKKEAEALLERLSKELEGHEKDYEKATTAFEKKWDENL